MFFALRRLIYNSCRGQKMKGGNMTLFNAMHEGFTMNIILELLLRLLIASACGIIIGIERSRRFKDAGVRTHFLVSFAACLIMIVSKYAFVDLVAGPEFGFGTRGADPSRIAAQVVSGVTFLGAGIIFRNRHHAVKGLTTAAGIWAASGVGLAIGAGLYYIGLAATFIVVILQLVMHRFAVGNDRYTTGEIYAVMKDDDETTRFFLNKLDEWKAVIVESDIERDDNKIIYILKVKLLTKNIHDEISGFVMSNPNIYKLKYEEWG